MTPVTPPTPDGANDASVASVNGTRMFWGAAAAVELGRLLALARAKAANSLTWVLPATSGSWEKAKPHLSAEEMSAMTAVVIHSSDVPDDGWQYTYYPGTQLGMYHAAPA